MRRRKHKLSDSGERRGRKSIMMKCWGGLGRGGKRLSKEGKVEEEETGRTLYGCGTYKVMGSVCVLVMGSVCPRDGATLQFGILFIRS